MFGMISPTYPILFGIVEVSNQESILEVSSIHSRDSFNVRLPDLLNEPTNTPRERGVDNTDDILYVSPC